MFVLDEMISRIRQAIVTTLRIGRTLKSPVHPSVFWAT
jgi:hypothetical protein